MWYMPIISAMRRTRQEEHKFEDSLGYIVRLCLKKKKKKNPNKKRNRNRNKTEPHQHPSLQNVYFEK
jgi:hypothetical protein